jgi:predicted Rossmann fold nucleotide-binding protein DprA/Smf involved in DNA uptake
MNEVLEKARQNVDALRERHIHALTSSDDGWPGDLNDLPPSHRPNVLYTYGNRKVLAEASVAIVGSAPVAPEPFETVQTLARRLAQAGVIVSCATEDGLDNVIIKILLASESLPLLVAGCGMAKIAPALRSSVSGAVKAGGVLASSFPMTHGPFDHDVRERSLVQSALAKAVVFVDPQETGFSWDALEWSLAHDKPVFALSTSPLSERVHVIQDEVDMDWVLAAVRHVPE